MFHVTHRAGQRGRLRWGIGVLVLLSLLTPVAAQQSNMILRSQKGAALTTSEFDGNITIMQNWVYTSGGSFVFTLGGSTSTSLATIPAAGGGRYAALTFTDSAADIAYALLLRAPVGWTTGTLQVVGVGADITAAPSGHALGFDVAAQCIGQNTTASDTWGDPQLLTLPFAVQNRFSIAQTSAITPAGTCTGGTDAAPRYVNVRLRVNTGTFACAPTPANCKLLNVDVRFNRP